MVTFWPSTYPASFRPWLNAGGHLCKIVGRSAVNEPYHRHRRLLRACRERPCSCRAAEQGDELAALNAGHGDFLPLPVVSAPPRPTGIRRCSVYRALNLPQNGRQVLGPDLNRSESTGALPIPPLPSPKR